MGANMKLALPGTPQLFRGQDGTFSTLPGKVVLEGKVLFTELLALAS